MSEVDPNPRLFEGCFRAVPDPLIGAPIDKIGVYSWSATRSRTAHQRQDISTSRRFMFTALPREGFAFALNDTHPTDSKEVMLCGSERHTI